MDYRHLWIRSTRQRAILKIRHEIIKAVRDFFDDDGFTLCDTPILTPAACEGTTTLFEVGYFEDKAYLTQSGQLYNEATAAALGRVYTFGPTFRAEKSKTRRHLTEFWMVEPEVAYATVEDMMDLAEQMLCFVVQRVLEKRQPELKALERDISKLENITPPFPRISYDEAVAMLQKNGSEIQWGGDFGGGDETIISQQFDKPVMVHRYPTAIKAFYMEPDPQRAGRRAVRRRPCAGRLWRNHRRRAAHVELRTARPTAEGARTAARSIRVVPGSSQVRLGSSCRLRHGNRTRRHLDLRPGTCSRNDSLSKNALVALKRG